MEHKQNLNDTQKNILSDEEQFILSYDINEFYRPSVAADVAAFTLRSEENDNYRRYGKTKLSLLLIRRGEYPFINKWALPGGFLRPNETIDACALREIVEETGIMPASIMPVGVFSDIDRDPRGRVISNAFVSIVSKGIECIRGGDDAVDARWFDISFDKLDNKVNSEYVLTLTNGDIELKSRLVEKEKRFGISKFEIADSGEIAFDHSAIIATALTALRRCIGSFDIVFDFLPEKFTLTELQCVQETILNISILPANFRRKAADYVVETDEYITGAGHRPARLYKRK